MAEAGNEHGDDFDLDAFLQNSQNPDAGIRAAAEAQFTAATQRNLPALLVSLIKVLADEPVAGPFHEPDGRAHFGPQRLAVGRAVGAVNEPQRRAVRVAGPFADPSPDRGDPCANSCGTSNQWALALTVNVPNSIAHRVPERIAERVAERVAKRVAERVAQRVSKRVTERISDHLHSCEQA